MTVTVAESGQQSTPTPGAPSKRQLRRGYAAGVIAILVLAGVLRGVTLTTALPYPKYIDEKYVIKPAAHQIVHRTWDPNWYSYPSLLINATTAGAAVHAVFSNVELTAGARATEASPYPEILEPPSLLLSGRVVVFLFALGTVLLVALLGTRLAGRRVGVFAALLTAVLPALVTRSSMVIVDTPAAFFVTAALYCATFVWSARRTLILTIAAGAMAGLAFASKYPAGAVILVVLVVIGVRQDRAVRERLRLGAFACAGAIVAAVVAMPALLVHPVAVLTDVRAQYRVYSRLDSPSYWSQIVQGREVGRLMLVLAAIGLVVLLRSRRSRTITIAYLVYAAVSLPVLLQASYQQLRNLLPLLPFACIAAAAAVVKGSAVVAERMRLARPVGTAIALAGTLAVCGSLYTSGVQPYLREQGDRIDTRLQARRWLARHVDSSDRVLVAEELAFLPRELKRIGAEIALQRQARPLRSSEFDYVIAGHLKGTIAWEVTLRLEGRTRLERFGTVPISTNPDAWHANQTHITIYGPAG